MKPGKLNEPLKLYAPTESTDTRYGSLSPGFEHRCTVWAQRVKQSGSSITEAGEIFADYRSDWHVRYGVPVAEHWRVVDIYGILYEVKTILPNVAKGLKTLCCERVNE